VWVHLEEQYPACMRQRNIARASAQIWCMAYHVVPVSGTFTGTRLGNHPQPRAQSRSWSQAVPRRGLRLVGARSAFGGVCRHSRKRAPTSPVQGECPARARQKNGRAGRSLARQRGAVERSLAARRHWYKVRVGGKGAASRQASGRHSRAFRACPGRVSTMRKSESPACAGESTWSDSST
jgi:hypothetical protein